MNAMRDIRIPAGVAGLVFGFAALAAAEVTLGPYVQFADFDQAVVRWETDVPCPSRVLYGLPQALDLEAREVAVTTVHEVTLEELEWQSRYTYRVNDGAGEFSDVYWFDNHINYTLPDVADAVSPYDEDGLTEAYARAAETIIRQAGIKAGYCLVYGCGEGRLAFELAKRSRLIIIGVDDDADRVQAARQKLLQANLYGTRINIRHVESLATLPFSKYFFNLIVSDRMIVTGALPGTAAEMYRVLRPSGGVAYMGQPAGSPNPLAQAAMERWLGAASLPQQISAGAGGMWAKVVRPELPGSGWWSHQYGTAAGSGNSFDNMLGASQADDYQLQWVGRPGADISLDRHVRMPAPVTAGGRMYHQGHNRMVAMDSYNGAIYWSLEVPHLRRVNMPREAGNACADENAVYVTIQNSCWRLDGESGMRTHTYKVDGSEYEWGGAFRVDDKLIGCAAIKGSSFTKYWGWEFVYDRYGDEHDVATHYKVCSEKLFAFDVKDDDQPVWTYESGVIINTTICMGGGKVFFLESRNPQVQGQPTGESGSRANDEALWKDLYMVALNADTGAKLWEKNLLDGAAGDPAVAYGQIVAYLLYAEHAGKEYLILQTSRFQGDAPDKTSPSPQGLAGDFYLYVYDAGDNKGRFQWQGQHAWAQVAKHLMKRALVVADAIYLFPNAYALNDGKVVRDDLPRAECGLPAAIGNTLCARYSSNDGVAYPQELFFDLGMWDIKTGKMTGWMPIRPGCWINMISGGHMLLMPEGGGSCSCNMYMQTSVGFLPVSHEDQTGGANDQEVN